MSSKFPLALVKRLLGYWLIAYVVFLAISAVLHLSRGPTTWEMTSWESVPLSKGHCEYAVNNLTVLAGYLRDEGNGWAADRLESGLSAYPSTYDFLDKPVFDCPDVFTKGISWLDEEAGRFRCTPGERLKISQINSWTYFSNATCPDNGEMVIEPGEVASAQLGILINPPFDPERLEKKRDCVAERVAQYGESARPPHILALIIDSLSRPMAEGLLVKTGMMLDEVAKSGDVSKWSFRRAHSAGGGTIRNTIPMTTGLGLHDLDLYREIYKQYEGPWIYKELAERSCYATGVTYNGCRKNKGTWPNHNPVGWSWGYPQSRMPYGPSMNDEPWNYGTFCDNDLEAVCGITEHGPCSTTVETVKIHKLPCVGGRSSLKVMVEHYLKFRKRYEDVPTFNWFHMMDNHADDLLMPARFDEEFVVALRVLEEAGVFEDTVVFLLSDHGYHGVSRMLLPTGSDEVKQPIRTLLIPNEILDRMGPEAKAMLDGNAGALTSPHDLFHTWLHMGSWDKRPVHWPFRDPSTEPPIYGQSWLEPMSENRTCFEAGVSPAECICGKAIESDVPDECREHIMEQTLPVIMAKLNENVNTNPRVCRKLVAKSVGRMTFQPLARIVARYEIDILVESPRAIPLELRVTVQTWNCLAAQDKVNTRNVDEETWDEVEVLGIAQVSRFGPWIAQCIEEASAQGVNLHLCDCIEPPKGGWGTGQ